MCAGRACLVPAARDLGGGAMRDFRAIEGSNIHHCYKVLNG